MKVAALYDIHGNLPALRAVLDDVAAFAPNLLVIGGDVVSGPQPEAVLDAIFGAGVLMRWVMGNADREVADGDGPAGAPATEIAAFAAERLRPEQLQLVETFQPSVATGGVLFCHGSPRADDEILTTLSAAARITEACARVRQRIVVCGHTHRQFDRQVGELRLINAGSIGRPFEGEAAAFWLAVEDGVPELRRTAYDVPAALDELRDTGMPGLEEHFLHGSLVEPADPDAISRELEALAG